MEEILRQPEDIINLFTVNIQDECNNLTDLNYYQEMQALDMLMAAMIQTGIAGFAGVAVKGDQEK